MHLGMNMMSMLSLGASLEQSIGTLQMLFTIMWQTVLCGTTSVATFWFMATVIFDDISYLKNQMVGFSGVIFAISVINNHKSRETSQSVMGLFSVPAKWYPWVLLVVLQVLIPHVSFVGHLSGILMGTLQAYGGFTCFLPSTASLREMESWSSLRLLVENSRFVPCPVHVDNETLTIRQLVEESTMTVRVVVRGVWQLIIACLRTVGFPSQVRNDPQAFSQYV